MTWCDTYLGKYECIERRSRQLDRKSALSIRRKVGMLMNTLMAKEGMHVILKRNNIEETTYKRAEIIIFALMSEDEKLIAKARRIFNLI